MNMIKTIAVVVAAGLSVLAQAKEELTPAQEAVAKAGPKKLSIMIAGFGTIESMTQVDKWLGEQLQPNSNLSNLPTLSEGDKIKDPHLDKEIVRYNWHTRKMEYLRESNALAAENLRNKQMLTALRTRVLTDTATRYVPLAKDYLQAALMKRCGSLIQIVDRSSADMAMVEQGLKGDDSSALSGATCIATVAMGDREEDSRTITVNGKGTQVKMTTYTQPYVGKIRDLQGNVLMAFNGTAEWSSKVNSVVKSEVSDPARKLVEAACAKIAGEIAEFFTTTLEFKVKTPKGSDADEVAIRIDGKSVDAEDGVVVLAAEHALVATLDGCSPIRRIIAIDEATPSKKVKLVFKKKAADKDDDDE